MAVIYCRSSDGNDSDNGSTWALAKATLAAAVTAAGSEGTVYLSDNHSELSTADITILSADTTADKIVKIWCVDDTSDPEPPTTQSTGAIVESGSTYDITINGSLYIYGVEFKTAAEAQNNQIYLVNENTTASYMTTLEKCKITNLATGTSSATETGRPTNTNFSRTLNFIETDLTISSAKAIIKAINVFVNMVGGTATGTTFLTTNGTEEPGVYKVRGMDLSGITDTIVSVVDVTQCAFDIANCELVSGVVLVSGSPSGGFSHDQVRIDNCSIANNNVERAYANDYGVASSDLSIYRTAGASDGTTNYSLEVISDANCTELLIPFRVELVSHVVDTATAKTVTVEIAQDGTSTALQDDEIWIEVHHQDDLTTTTHIETNRAADIFATPVNQTSSSEGWTGLGGTNVKQKLEVTTSLTGKSGMMTVYLVISKPSTTVYIDPYLTIS